MALDTVSFLSTHVHMHLTPAGLLILTWSHSLFFLSLLPPIAWTLSFLLCFSLPLRRHLDYKVLRCYRKSRSEPGHFGQGLARGRSRAKVLHDLRSREEVGYYQEELQQWELRSKTLVPTMHACAHILTHARTHTHTCIHNALFFWY